jgi:GDP-4-dehydro-6-deoxy-D-mannose reductase
VRYLITGITGFVGPHLANLLLDEGHEVCGFIRAANGREDDIREIVPDAHYDKLKFLYGDLTDYESCLRAMQADKFDGVFHLAAQSHPPTSFADPRGTFLANAVGTMNLAEAIRAVSPACRMMFCSTSEVYGAPEESEGPIHENFPLRTCTFASGLPRRICNSMSRALFHTPARAAAGASPSLRTFTRLCAS